MAVFPYARRALWRPAQLPWLIAVAVVVATSFALFGTLLLKDGAPPAATTPPVPGASSTFLEAPVSRTGRLTPVEGATFAAELLLTEIERSALAMATASDAVMAAEEAAFAVALPTSRTEAPAAAETVAEVSEAPVQTVAEPSTQSATNNGAEAVAPATSEPATVAPATVTQPVAEAPAPPPAQPIPVAPTDPIERWAAAGIIIETQRQALDDASLANIDAALSSLPAGVLGNLGNPVFGPLHILVNTEGRALSGDQPYGGPANFFSTNEGTNELVLYPQQSVFTIVHELGHAYNLRRVGAGRYAMVLLDSEMRSFLGATGWQIAASDDDIRRAVDHMHVSYTYSGSFHWPRLSNDDPLEDFANSFAMYFLDPGTLSQSSPERYAWMAGAFGQ